MLPVVRSYYSTFIPGLLEPVQEALKGALPDSRISLSLDGLLAYESDAKIEVIRKLPFATNTFCVFKGFAGKDTETLMAMAAKVLDDPELSFETRKSSGLAIPSGS